MSDDRLTNSVVRTFRSAAEGLMTIAFITSAPNWLKALVLLNVNLTYLISFELPLSHLISDSVECLGLFLFLHLINNNNNYTLKTSCPRALSGGRALGFPGALGSAP